MLAESLSIAVAGLQTHRGEIEVARKGRVRVLNKAHKGREGVKGWRRVGPGRRYRQDEGDVIRHLRTSHSHMHSATRNSLMHTEPREPRGARQQGEQKPSRAAPDKFAIPVRHTAIKASERKEQTGVARSGHLAPAGALSIRRSRS